MTSHQFCLTLMVPHFSRQVELQSHNGHRDTLTADSSVEKMRTHTHTIATWHPTLLVVFSHAILTDVVFIQVNLRPLWKILKATTSNFYWQTSQDLHPKMPHFIRQGSTSVPPGAYWPWNRLTRPSGRCSPSWSQRCGQSPAKWDGAAALDENPWNYMEMLN